MPTGAPGMIKTMTAPALRAPASDSRPRLSRDWRDWLGLAFRLYLGGMLLVAGVIKMGNLALFALNINAYHLVPYSWTKILGYSIPPLEIIVGLLLVLGCFTRITAAIGALLMAMFTFSIAWVWAKGYSIDCGCFGHGGDVAPGTANYLPEIIRDVAAFAGGVWLVWRPKTFFSLDGWLFGAPKPDPYLDADLDDQLDSVTSDHD